MKSPGGVAAFPFAGDGRSIINGETPLNRERFSPRANCPNAAKSFVEVSSSAALPRGQWGRDKKFTRHTSRGARLEGKGRSGNNTSPKCAGDSGITSMGVGQRLRLTVLRAGWLRSFGFDF